MIDTYLYLFACFATLVHAHNWINSASRSPKDNTVAPALPSATGTAHVQVIANQGFQVEWQQGHGSFTYFVLAKKEDYAKLNNHKNLANLDKYLESKGANKSPPTGKWQKFHRTAGTTPVNTHGGVANYFAGQAQASHYITRSDVFLNRFKGYTGKNNIYQWTYKSDCTKDDRRTFHSDPEFPWIIGMWRFLICKHEPARPDVALFNVPAGTPPGEYLLHYRWRGYYDVVDVEVVAGNKAVALPYGEKPDPMNLPPPVFQRIPHCEFKNPESTTRCMRIVTNTESCVQRCGRLAYLQCNGINVVRAANPNIVGFPDVNIPYDTGDNTLCKKTDVLRGLGDGDALTQRAKVCYGLTAGSNPGFGPYYITNDPRDPAFYSTCFVRVPPVIRDGPPPVPEKPPTGVMALDDFIFQGMCLSACSWGYRSRRGDMPANYPVRTNRCDDCRRQGTNAYMGYKYEQPTSAYNARLTKLSTGKRWDGQNRKYRNTPPCPAISTGEQNCLTRVQQYGSGAVEVDTMIADTVELIRRKYSTVCSNKFHIISNQTDTATFVQSFCVRKTPACCLDVTEITDRARSTYTIDQKYLDLPLGS